MIRKTDLDKKIYAIYLHAVHNAEISEISKYLKISYYCARKTVNVLKKSPVYSDVLYYLRQNFGILKYTDELTFRCVDDYYCGDSYDQIRSYYSNHKMRKLRKQGLGKCPKRMPALSKIRKQLAKIEEEKCKEFMNLMAK